MEDRDGDKEQRGFHVYAHISTYEDMQVVVCQVKGTKARNGGPMLKDLDGGKKRGWG